METILTRIEASDNPRELSLARLRRSLRQGQRTEPAGSAAGCDRRQLHLQQAAATRFPCCSTKERMSTYRADGLRLKVQADHEGMAVHFEGRSDMRHPATTLVPWFEILTAEQPAVRGVSRL